MSLVFLDGFDHYTTSAQGEQKYATFSNTAIVTGGRTANQAQLQGGNGHIATKAHTPHATAIAACSMSLTVVLGSSSQPALVLREGSTDHVGMWIDAAGVVTVRRGATILGTAATIWVANQRYHVQLKGTIHDSTGSAELRINNVTEVSLSGIDTRNGGTTGLIDTVAMRGRDFANVNVDDLYVLNGAGTDNNDFIGDLKIDTMYATAAGNSTQFTPSAGSNWQNVDDATPNDDTDYNSSSTAGQIDLFTLGNLPTISGTIEGIQVANRWRKDDGGSRTGRRVIRTDSTNFEGADVAISDSYVYNFEIIEANPDTSSDWTIAEVDALEVGYKIEA